jgi:hypothetical protein
LRPQTRAEGAFSPILRHPGPARRQAVQREAVQREVA